MFANLKERMLPHIIGFGMFWLNMLSINEELVERAYRAKLPMVMRKTKQTIVLGMMGLVGSGKTTVAKQLAERIGATVISSDDLRVELRKKGMGYEKTHMLALTTALHLAYRGRSVILDSDFINDAKRASTRHKFSKFDGDALLFGFVRVHDNLDIRVGHSITASYNNSADDFFGGASTAWNGSDQTKGAVVKLREMIRRLPHHYDWKNEGGGTWVLKKPPCKLLADIDTSDEVAMAREIAALVTRLKTGVS